MPDGGSSSPVPAQRAPNLMLQALLLVLAAGLAGFTILQGIAPHDEGLMLQAGSRIASGQWPYRDFWMNYEPGQPILLAGLQKLFGPSLLAWRVMLVTVDAVVALLVYRLSRRRACELYALGAWLAVAGAMAYPSLPGPNPPALLLAFAALMAADQAPRAAGLLAGLACFFRLEIGIAAIAGVVLEAPRGARSRAVLIAVSCALVMLAPFFAVAPGAMWHDTIGFYAIQGLQRLPFPLDFHGPLKPSKLIEFYAPLTLVVALALWVLAAMTGLRRARDSGMWSAAPLAIVGLGYLLGRTDEFHLVPLAAVLPVMLAWAAAAAPSRALRGALLVALTLLAAHGIERRVGQARHPPALAAVPGGAGDGVETDPADARSLAALERELALLTRPGEPIFVANPRFDLVHAGDPLLYIITGHPNPTRYDVMQPGVVTSAPVQREIISSLQRSHTRVVVRWLDPLASLVEPNGAGRSSGVHVLDRYLGARFEPIARFGFYEVLVQRGSTP
ncbi:MAG: hypothetical protein ACLP0J_29480 [Solirubrobacteraceae bacterium]